MRICFYFVLFFIAKCLNFCCDDCVECCYDWWNNFWEDCFKKSKEEEKKDDPLNNYREEQNDKNLQYMEGIREQKEELKNKIRRYLNHIKNTVEKIIHNFENENSLKAEILDQIFKINNLIGNFQNDEYFNRNLIENIQKDLNELQDLCSKAKIITFDDFYKKNEEWEKFLEGKGIQETYNKEENITQENFSLKNTLDKLKGNLGTYLLAIFKTRLYPIDKNGDKYKDEFMNFYTGYNIESWTNIWDEDYLQDFYKKIFQKVNLDILSGYEENAFEIYKEGLLQKQHLYLGYALLTNGDESKIIEEIHEKIECKLYTDAIILKIQIIPVLINSFKHNIVEIIKDSLQEQLNLNKNLQKDNSENIKNAASIKYNEAIRNLNGEKIELTFYNSYGKMGTYSFFKNCKLSVLFDYVLSKGRKFYASNEEGEIVDENLGYVNYEDEKGKLELKTALNRGGDVIENNENITIGEFYEKPPPNVFMLFKKE